MRRTATFSAHVLDVAEALESDDAYRTAAFEIGGREVPASESGRIDLLASIGATFLTRAATERRYEHLAAWLDADPTPWGVQTTKGRPPADEDDAGIEALVAALAE